VCRAILLLVAFVAAQASAQVPASPKREVRAVWITTAAGLDWPKTTDPREQKASLRSILLDLHRANFNTVFFQVRARGDAYYRSSFEPWAENLTGTLGADPGWDPLAFLLAQAHALGMEVHAWFNVFKVRGPLPVTSSTPPHVTRAHPNWTVEEEGELWLDPGLPEVRRYLVEVASDLIRNYDLDGINFDFLRYPGRAFPDQETYRRYGNGYDRDVWRRSNIDAFVDDFAARARTLRPMLRIGSSPLGVYQTDAASSTLGSYQAVYQDSEGWLRRGVQDYLSPQIYWDIGTTKGNPDFGGLVRRWQQGSAGRQIYAGIAAYKPEVFNQIPRQIDLSREAGNAGQAYFRLQSIRPLNMFAERYSSPALIPPMPWKDSLPPLPPSRLAVAEMVTNTFSLEWTPSAKAADGDTACAYVVYRNSPSAPRTDVASQIIAVLPASCTAFVDTVKIPMGLTYQYAVTALDRAENESAPSMVGSGVVRELLALKGKLSDVTALSASVVQPGRTPTLLAYQLPAGGPVRLSVLKVEAGEEHVIAVLVDGPQQQGTHILGVGTLQLPPGGYTLRLHAGGTTVEQALVVRP
jgi:uncharacterized lipoprotein YddW (UPF0748 family)